jgi:hypothetical protein
MTGTMRKILYAVAIAAFAAGVAPRQAEAQLLRLGVGAGPSIPAGDFATGVDTGVHAAAMLALRIPLLPLSVRGDLMYQRFGATGGDVDQFAGIANGFFNILPLPVVSAYVSGGVGLYHTRAAGVTSSDIGLNGGIGARINLWLVEPFAEVRYHHVLGTDGPRTVPVTIGVMF